MHRKILSSFMALGLAAGSLPALAGTYSPAADQAGSTAVSKDSTDIVQWAAGYQNYQPGSNVAADFKTPEKALGKAVGSSFDIVSLGDQGRITLSFSGVIRNGPGWDFAVFENSFSDTFLELAFVEVSSNGNDFYRFPSFSFTASPVGGFGTVDPTNIDGLAGKYRQGFGTPFDLDLFKNVPGLNVNSISHIRVVDVKGDGSELDSLFSPIYDPSPTTGSGGFDLDAIGVRYYVAAAPVPEPSVFALLAAGLGLVGWRVRRRESI